MNSVNGVSMNGTFNQIYELFKGFFKGTPALLLNPAIKQPLSVYQPPPPNDFHPDISACCH